MSEQASTQDHAAASPRPAPDLGSRQDGAAQPLRILGIAVACVVVAALAAATFVLSYSAIRGVAAQAGISPQHARDYPLLIDAMLVIALAAVLVLRGAGLPSRILAWLTLLAVLAAAAAADALHATGHVLRYNVGASIAAILPWALVLIAFLLLLAVLRHARLRRQRSATRPLPARDTEPAGTVAGRPGAARPAPPLPVRTPRSRDSASIVPGLSAQLVSSAAAGAAAGAATAAPDRPVLTAEAGADAGLPDQVDPPAADAHLGPADADTDARGDSAASDPPAEPGLAGPESAAGDAALAAAGDAALADAGGREAPEAADESYDRVPDDPATADFDADDAADMPVFHRMWSTPTPPDS